MFSPTSTLCCCEYLPRINRTLNRQLKILYTGHEDKSLVHPYKVAESLLSTSCDPKEVVLQLIESLQLNQASLEQPDSVTKRLVRYLATKAKQLDRLDVVKQLRDFTPTGTVGKLVI